MAPTEVHHWAALAALDRGMGLQRHGFFLIGARVVLVCHIGMLAAALD